MYVFFPQALFFYLFYSALDSFKIAPVFSFIAICCIRFLFNGSFNLSDPFSSDKVYAHVCL